MNENHPTTVPVGRGALMSGFIRDQVYRPARRDRFVGRYLGVQNQLGSGNPANLNPPRSPRPSPLPRPLDGRMGTSDEERENNTLLAARNANRLILPKNFPAEKGKLFARLINLCLEDINSRLGNNPRDTLRLRVSSLELWKYVQRNKKNLNHFAWTFKDYSEDDFRLFPKSWLSLDIPPEALAKCMSYYASNHSGQHMEFLKEIGFTYENMVGWMLDVLKKRCSLNIQSFERYTRYGFAVSYQIPVTPRKLDNKFKATQLSIKIVIAYKLRNSDTYHKRGKLVTVYLQNTKLQSYEKDGILKKSPNAIQRNSLGRRSKCC